MVENLLERVQGDTRQAMKAGDRELVGVLRMLSNSLQAEHKEGKGDEVAVLRRERKRRLEAAQAYRDGGHAERAAAEEAEAEVIDRYLPAELSDDELGELIAGAIEEVGAAGPEDMGKVMGAVMPKVDGRAGGSRVSALARERLGG